MSTNAYIGIQKNPGEDLYEVAHIRSDGYLSGVGKDAVDWLGRPDELRAVIRRGAMQTFATPDAPHGFAKRRMPHGPIDTFTDDGGEKGVHDKAIIFYDGMDDDEGTVRNERGELMPWGYDLLTEKQARDSFHHEYTYLFDADGTTVRGFDHGEPAFAECSASARSGGQHGGEVSTKSLAEAIAEEQDRNRGGGIPDLREPPVRDARTRKASQPKPASYSEAELRGSLPPGVSMSQSGYRGKYKS